MNDSLHTIFEDASSSLLAVTAQRLLALDSTALSVDERLQYIQWLIVCHEHAAALACVQNVWSAELSPTQQAKVYAALVRCGPVGSEYSVPPKALLARWLVMRKTLGVEYIYPTEIVEFIIYFDTQKQMHVQLKMRCLACQSEILTEKSSDFLPYRAQEAGQWMCPHCLALCEYDPVKVRQRVFSLYDAFFQNLSRDADGFLSEHDAALALMSAITLRPFGLIRFLNLYSEKIGHYLFNTSIYYSRRLMGVDETSLDYLGLKPGTPAINATLTEMWQRLLPLSSAAGQIAAKLGITENTHTLRQVVDSVNALERYPISFPFTCRENMDAQSHMERMGIPRGSKFVCLLCRTDDYVKNEVPDASPNVYMSYRNSPLENFRPAIEYLVSKGYYVLRMGTELMPPISWKGTKLIDYAREYRTEFMDIWLFAHADLTVGTSSGIDCIPVIMGRNLLYVTFSPMGYSLSFSRKTTTLFDHYYSTKARRRLRIREILASGFATKQSESEFAQSEFCIEKNTADEILEAVKEKVFIMEGGTRSDEDLQLEQAFISLFDTYKDKLVDWYSPAPWYKTPLHGPKYYAQVSSVFLRQYRDELLAVAGK